MFRPRPVYDVVDQTFMWTTPGALPFSDVKVVMKLANAEGHVHPVAFSAGSRAGIVTSPECDISPRTDPPDRCARTGGSILHLVRIGEEPIYVVLMFASASEPPADAHSEVNVARYASTVNDGIDDCIDGEVDSFPQDLTAVARCISTYIGAHGLASARGLAVVASLHAFTGSAGHVMVARLPLRLQAFERGQRRMGPRFGVVLFPPAVV